MSLRRSARSQAKPIKEDLPNAKVAVTATVSKKRGRKSQASNEDISTSAIVPSGDSLVANADMLMLPPEVVMLQQRQDNEKLKTTGELLNAPVQTPNKKRKVANVEAKPLPITPTPLAIGFMIRGTGNHSTGDIDDAAPTPAARPAEPHHTNATLVTPQGTQIQPTYSDLVDAETSPSKPAPPRITSKSLLDEACAHLLKVDPDLKTVIDKHHCKVFSPEGLAEKIDPFRSLTSGIMAQQVSGAAASSIKNKFIALFEPKDCPNNFPTPTIVAAMPLPRLREAGLSQRKAEYIQGLAQKFVTGDLTVPMLMDSSDQEVMEKLVAVRGLGVWSVEMFMCFGLKRMDVFSTGDLGVQRGMAVYKGKDVKKLKGKGGGKWKYLAEKDMIEGAERFRPYRSLFMWYMWRIEDVNVDAVQNA